MTPSLTTSLRIGIPLISCIGLASCQPKEKTIVVEKLSEAWYENEANLQPSIYGQAEILKQLNPSCNKTDLGFTPKAIEGFYTGSHMTITEDRMIDQNSYEIASTRNTKSVIKSEEERISICPPLEDHPSIESVALKIAKEVEHSHQWYQQSAEHLAQKIAKIGINVHPLVERKRYYRNNYLDTQVFQISDLVDNAYFMWQEDKKVIAFFPHASEESLSLTYNPVPLWNLAFVARHEYGHLIFQTHMEKTLSSPQWDYFSYMQNHPFLHTTQPQEPRSFFDMMLKPAEPAIDSYFIISALNEGFADLFALYSSTNELPGIEEAPCFIDSRDPRSPVFQDGVKKVWTENILSSLLDRDYEEEATETYGAPCGAFQKYSFHHIGALLAHSVDQIFLRSFELTHFEGDIDAAKLQLAIRWLNDFKDHLSLADQGPRGILSQIIESAWQVAMGEQTLNPEDDLCEFVKESFSGFKPYWQAKNSQLAVCFD